MIHSFVRNTVAWLLSAFYLSGSKMRHLKKASSKGEILLSIYFHNPSHTLFTSCVLWLKKKGFAFISVAELQDIIANKKPLPPSSVVLTVDDGWKENKENIAQVAEQLQVPVTIFISTEPVEKEKRFWWSVVEDGIKNRLTNKQIGELKHIPDEEKVKIIEQIENQLPKKRDALTIDEVKEIANGNFITIGSHTVSHPILTQCKNEQSLFEINASKKKLEDWLKKPVTSFAYPNGMYGEREKKYLSDGGYTIAFNTIPEYVTRETLNTPFDIPRFDVLEEVSLMENYCRMTGIWFQRKNKKRESYGI
jgi:peptidoglycan/xylan/chitin deacetylase (PgdA/CDA1 family)